MGLQIHFPRIHLSPTALTAGGKLIRLLLGAVLDGHLTTVEISELIEAAEEFIETLREHQEEARG